MDFTIALAGLFHLPEGYTRTNFSRNSRCWGPRLVDFAIVKVPAFILQTPFRHV
jgi:hypothetical protein